MTAKNSVTRLSQIGGRGLVIYKGGYYYYVTETDLRGYLLNGAPPANVATMSGLNVVVGAVTPAASASQQVFVNFDELSQLVPAEQGAPALSGSVVPASTSVLVQMTDAGALRYLVANEGDWQKLPPGAQGDAGVLVNRAAIVAPIPSNPLPYGTYCVLVNMDGVK